MESNAYLNSKLNNLLASASMGVLDAERYFLPMPDLGNNLLSKAQDFHYLLSFCGVFTSQQNEQLHRMIEQLPFKV